MRPDIDAIEARCEEAGVTGTIRTLIAYARELERELIVARAVVEVHRAEGEDDQVLRDYDAAVENRKMV